MRVYYEKLGHMLNPLVPKFRSDPSVRLRDIAEKQVAANRSTIVKSDVRSDTHGYRLQRWIYLPVWEPAKMTPITNSPGSSSPRYFITALSSDLLRPRRTRTECRAGIAFDIDIDNCTASERAEQ